MLPNVDSLTQLWDRVRTSLWFVPGMMSLGALVLAIAISRLDRAVSDEWLSRIPLVFSGRPAGGRAVLSTIAGSMITIAGVVFSMTIVSLQLASAQFGPRLLRTFLRDRGNQVVLGTFVGTCLFCILVLPSIDTTGESSFVPHIAVTTAVLLAVVSLGMLVYFIDHVAQSIHADAVIHSVGCELDQTIDQLFPETIGEGDSDQADAESVETAGAPVVLHARCAGYLRFVNGDAILAVACEHDLVVRVEMYPGRYVFDNDPIASVWPEASLSEDAAKKIVAAFVLGAHRTTLQDATFAFEQLAEMAVRALSQGINDPTTAIHCIDRMGSGLLRLVNRELPSGLRRDGEGVVRILAEPLGLVQILEGGFEPIARCAGTQLPVWLRLLHVLEVACDRARRANDRTLLRDQASRLAQRARAALEHEHDHKRLAAAVSWTSA